MVLGDREDRRDDEVEEDDMTDSENSLVRTGEERVMEKDLANLERIRDMPNINCNTNPLDLLW